jgi:3-hydroxyisobutyrate dehydrogenase-like beta-hydroxyacid dehydrogenase
LSNKEKTTVKIGFVGLGSMGSPMALNLVFAGHSVTVYNRTRSRADELVESGVQVAVTPREAAREAEVLVTMLSDDSALEAVMFGEDGALDGLRPGMTHVSMSTISVALSRRLAQAHEAAGQAYVAAPVFGRPEAAEGGKLLIVAAGLADAIANCRPIFNAVGHGVIEVGEDVAVANVIKLAGNFLLASAIEAIGEAFALVRKYGVDPNDFLDIVNERLIRSPIYEKYGKIIIEERYEPAGFKLSLGFKDVRLALAAAEEVNVPLPLANLLRDHFASAVDRGWENIDWAGLGRVCAEDAGFGS